MSSGSPPLPPSSFANAHAQARIDQIAVRVIAVSDTLDAPDTLDTRGTPQKGSGSTSLPATVTAHNDDGSLTLRTDHGDVRIMLRDKASLPEGTRLILTLPAGRSAQQATISPAPNFPPNSTPNPPSPPPPPSPLVQTPMTPPILGDSTISESPQPVPIATGDVTPNQWVRLLPLPVPLPPALQAILPPHLLSALLTSSASGLSANGLTRLIALINALPASGVSTNEDLRTMLLTFLNRMGVDSGEMSGKLSGTGISAQPPNLTPSTNTSSQPIDLSLLSSFDTINPKTPPSIKSQQSVSFHNLTQALDGRIIALLPDGNSPLTINNLPHTPSITTSSNSLALAHVVADSDTQLPVLSIISPHNEETPLYTLQFRANNLPVGTFLLLTLDPADPLTHPAPPVLPSPPPSSLPSSLPSGLSPSLARELAQWMTTPTWDSLDQLATHLATASSANSLATSLANSLAGQMMIPSPAQPHSMAALSLFFLAMIRTGDTEGGWLSGDATTLLRQMGKTSLLHAATADLAFTAKLDQLALPQDWRMTLLPLMWNNHIHKAPLYYKHIPDESDPESDTAKKRKKLRFLFDLSLSRMGAVQVDGFMQSQRLDIILRTRTPLSPPMQRQMKQLYAGAMDKSRLTGDLSFQFKPDQWVNVTDFTTHSSTTTGFHA